MSGFRGHLEAAQNGVTQDTGAKVTAVLIQWPGNLLYERTHLFSPGRPLQRLVLMFLLSRHFLRLLLKLTLSVRNKYFIGVRAQPRVQCVGWKVREDLK